MTHESDKIREVIVRLSLSGLPPTLQEGVISRVGDLSVSQLDEILAALTAFDQTQEQYLGQIDRSHAHLAHPERPQPPEQSPRA